MYYLFSAIHRCQPCRVLVQMLDKEIPNWKDKIEYIDVDHSTDEQRALAIKLGIMSLPTFGDKDGIILKGYSINNFNKIKELCTSE